MNQKRYGFRIVMGLLLATLLLTGLSGALLRTGGVVLSYAAEIPLPSAPPEVDDTPVSHQPEPDGFRAPESTAPELPPPAPASVAAPTPVPPATAPRLFTVPALDTDSVLLIGAAIWYVFIIMGITGGRHGVRRKRH